jgi:hypothetical protein
MDKHPVAMNAPRGGRRAAAWNQPVPTLVVVRRMAVFSIPWCPQYAFGAL